MKFDCATILKWTLVIVVGLVVLWIVFFYYPSGFKCSSVEEGFFEQIGSVNTITLVCNDEKLRQIYIPNKWGGIPNDGTGKSGIIFTTVGDNEKEIISLSRKSFGLERKQYKDSYGISNNENNPNDYAIELDTSYSLDYGNYSSTGFQNYKTGNEIKLFEFNTAVPYYETVYLVVFMNYDSTNVDVDVDVNDLKDWKINFNNGDKRITYNPTSIKFYYELDYNLIATAIITIKTTTSTSTMMQQPESTTTSTSTMMQQPESTTTSTSTMIQQPESTTTSMSTMMQQPESTTTSMSTMMQQPVSTTTSMSTMMQQPESTTTSMSTMMQQPESTTTSMSTMMKQPESTTTSMSTMMKQPESTTTSMSNMIYTTQQTAVYPTDNLSSMNLRAAGGSLAPYRQPSMPVLTTVQATPSTTQQMEINQEGSSSNYSYNTNTGISSGPIDTGYSSDEFRLFDKGLRILGSYLNNPVPDSLKYFSPGTFISQIDYRGSTNVYSPLLKFGVESNDKFANINDPDNYYHY